MTVLRKINMRFYLTLILLTVIFATQGQKYVMEKGSVNFFSDAAIEDIKADNKKVSGLFNVSSGDIAFVVPIKEFSFDKPLMKEHFNDKYMETEKYPKATFQGKVEQFDINKSNQTVEAVGNLTIHGVTQAVTIPGTIVKNGDSYSFKSVFVVKLADHKIQIPKLLWQNIAEQVEVTFEGNFKPK